MSTLFNWDHFCHIYCQVTPGLPQQRHIHCVCLENAKPDQLLEKWIIKGGVSLFYRSSYHSKKDVLSASVICPKKHHFSMFILTKGPPLSCKTSSSEQPDSPYVILRNLRPMDVWTKAFFLYMNLPQCGTFLLSCSAKINLYPTHLTAGVMMLALQILAMRFWYR